MYHKLFEGYLGCYTQNYKHPLLIRYIGTNATEQISYLLASVLIKKLTAKQFIGQFNIMPTLKITPTQGHTGWPAFHHRHFQGHR